MKPQFSSKPLEENDFFSSSNHTNSSVYEINEKEWHYKFFEDMRISITNQTPFSSSEMFNENIKQQFKLVKNPYYLVLLVQISGTIPEIIEGPDQPLLNIKKTNKDHIVITQYPFITESWKANLDDYYFPSNKSDKEALKWIIFFVVGPFIELSTVTLFHRAWLNNAQGQQTKITKCPSLVKSINDHFKRPDIIELGKKIEGINQTTVPISVYITPIKLEDNFKIKDINLPHMSCREKEEEYKNHLLELSKNFPSVKKDFDEFIYTDGFKWNKWDISETNGVLELIPKDGVKNVLGDFI